MVIILRSSDSHARPGPSSARWGRTASVPARAVTHEQQATARRGDGPGGVLVRAAPTPSPQRSLPVCAGLCRSVRVCALGRLRAGRLGGAGARVEGRVLALQPPELFFLFSFALESALYKQSESAMTTTITKGPKLGDAASLYVSSSLNNEISKLQAHPHAIPPPSLLAFPHTHHTHLPQLEFHAQSGVDPRGSQDFETLYVPLVIDRPASAPVRSSPLHSERPDAHPIPIRTLAFLPTFQVF